MLNHHPRVFHFLLLLAAFLFVQAREVRGDDGPSLLVSSDEGNDPAVLLNMIFDIQKEMAVQAMEISMLKANIKAMQTNQKEIVPNAGRGQDTSLRTSVNAKTTSRRNDHVQPLHKRSHKRHRALQTTYVTTADFDLYTSSIQAELKKLWNFTNTTSQTGARTALSLTVLTNQVRNQANATNLRINVLSSRIFLLEKQMKNVTNITTSIPTLLNALQNVSSGTLDPALLNEIENITSLAIPALSSRLSNLYSEVDSTRGDLISQLNATDEAVTALSVDLGDLYSNVDAAQGDLQVQLNETSQTLANLSTVISDVGSDLSTTKTALQSQLSTTNNNVASVTTQINVVNSNLTTTRTSLQSQLSTTNSNVASLTTQINTVNSDLTTTKSNLQSQLNTMNQTVQKINQRCFFSCADAYQSGFQTSGVYKLCPSGLFDSQFSAYCDQSTDGGGWMLFFSYYHVAGQNNPTVLGTLPTSPTSGYSHINLNSIPGYNTSNVQDLRFYCDSSNHTRKMHFKTSNSVVKGIALTGSQANNTAAAWNTAFTPLSGHNAVLPSATNNYWITAAGGFADFPFIKADNPAAVWGVRSGSFDCDSYTTSTAYTTNHQVWVRMATEASILNVEVDSTRADLQSQLNATTNSIQSQLSTTNTNVATLTTQVNVVNSNLTTTRTSLQSQLSTTNSNVASLTTQINTVNSDLTTTKGNLQGQLNTMNQTVQKINQRCFFSCMDAYQSGFQASGLYKLCPSGLFDSQFSAYCDQSTDGGGWMLFFSYNHVGGQNNPTVLGTLPTDPNNGYSHINLNSIPGYNTSNIQDVRLYCESANHTRKVHFKTSNSVVKNMAFSGSQVGCSASVWNTGYTTLTGHTGIIPAGADGAYTAYSGFTDFPLYKNGFNHCGVKPLGGSRFECDDATNSIAYTTRHQVWVRMSTELSNLNMEADSINAATISLQSQLSTTNNNVASLQSQINSVNSDLSTTKTNVQNQLKSINQTIDDITTCYFSCTDVFKHGYTASGIYELCPTKSPSSIFSAYCDQSTDGGGWMLFLAYYHAAGTSINIVQGILPTSPSYGGSHINLNSIPGYTTASIQDIRFYCQTTSHTRKIHFKTSNSIVKNIAYTGSQAGNTASAWNTGYTTFADHTGYLPSYVSSVYTASTGGLYDWTFWYGSTYEWGVRSAGNANYYQCDDGTRTNAYTTLHQVWVRMTD